MKIAVAGGTGVVGSALVTLLKEAGHEPVVLARATGVDLLAAPGSQQSGLEDHLDGVEAVVDVTSVGTTSAKAATEFFTRTTGNLLSAGYAAGVRHHGCSRSSASTSRRSATTSASSPRSASSRTARSRRPSCGRPSSTNSPVR